MSVKISFIIPVYNGERYLPHCLNSFYEQGLSDEEFEIICVDDCSVDNSKSIIKAYQEQHGNIFLIEHFENKKAGGARNTGVNCATGEYVWFVDADDYIADDAVRLVIDVCGKFDLDVLCFNYSIVAENGDKLQDELFFGNSDNAIDGISFMIEKFGNSIVHNLGYPWRAVYRRKIIKDNNIFFVENVLYGEETTFMAEVLITAKSVMCVSNAMYCYRQNEQSATSQLFQQMRGELIYQSIIVAGNMVLDLQNRVKNHSTELADCINKGLPFFVNRLFIRLVRTTSKERDKFYIELTANKRQSNDKDLLSVLPYMDNKNKFVLKNPFLGKVFLDAVSCFYKVKKAMFF